MLLCCVLQGNLDQATVDWGIKVERVEMLVYTRLLCLYLQGSTN